MSMKFWNIYFYLIEKVLLSAYINTVYSTVLLILTTTIHREIKNIAQGKQSKYNTEYSYLINNATCNM